MGRRVVYPRVLPLAGYELYGKVRGFLGAQR